MFTLSNIQIYLIVINILSFLLTLISGKVRKGDEGGWLSGVVCILSAAGGALGSLLSLLLFDRKPVKGNMLNYITGICFLVVQVLVVVFMRGNHEGAINLDVWNFFAGRRSLLMYLLVLNVLALIVYGVDKFLAIKDKSRIPIVVLLGIAFIGGSVGSWIAMYVFRHKTKKIYFTAGVPMILMMQLAVMLFVMNI